MRAKEKLPLSLEAEEEKPVSRRGIGLRGIVAFGKTEGQGFRVFHSVTHSYLGCVLKCCSESKPESISVLSSVQRIRSIFRLPFYWLFFFVFHRILQPLQGG